MSEQSEPDEGSGKSGIKEVSSLILSYALMSGLTFAIFHYLLDWSLTWSIVIAVLWPVGVVILVFTVFK